MDDRSHRHEIEIAATAEELWTAITTPHEISKWFDDVAELEPKEGGAFRFAGQGLASERSRIDVWDPPRRFKIDSPPTPAPGGGGSPEAAAQSFDYTIESRGDRCILRLTHSGIPADSSWDPYYDGSNNGWDTVLRTLRHVVEQNPGEHVAKLTIFGGTDLPVDEAWARAVGPSGVLEDLSDRAADDPFDITTSMGDRWSGKVLYRRDPEGSRNRGGSMTLAVDQLGRAVVSFATEPMMGPKNIVAVNLILFDPAHGDAAERYRKLFEDAFQVEPI